MKLMLHVAPGIVRYPVVASVILETGALVNIERASIDAVSGEIVLEAPAEKYQEVIEAFERRGVRVVPLEIPVVRDENECVHCGACVSICPTEDLPLRGLAGGGGLGKVHPVRGLRGGLPPEGAEAGAEVGKGEGLSSIFLTLIFILFEFRAACSLELIAYVIGELDSTSNTCTTCPHHKNCDKP